MPLLDQDPIDPEIAATLEAIDATLAGEPVDGRYADIAEIALLLASDRPEVPPAFATSMDQKVGRRFAAVANDRPRRRRHVRFWEATGVVAAGVALILAVVVVAGGGGGGYSGASSSTSATVSSAAPSSSGGSVGSAAAASAPSRSAASSGSTPSTHSVPGSKAQGELVPPTNSTTGSSAGSSASGTFGPTLQPPTTGRKVIQGAQLNLTAAPNRIDAVAQEIYDVVGQANGVVENSSVTQGGPGGYANFQLSVSSAGLGQTMSQLSSVNYATVLARTDSSQDITDQYGAATRALADARALRTSLLKQLANAATTEQVDSLNAQIHDAEASISSDEATLNRLNHQVNYSEVYVTVQARSAPAPVSHGDGGFTLGRAAHDAGRVLTVGAGIALIAIAALAPIALLVALVWWVGSTLKRRRREQALDSV
jgi:Domain of unknown function (DUF4349)